MKDSEPRSYLEHRLIT